MNKIPKANKIRAEFEKDFADDELVQALCDTIVEILENTEQEKDWFNNVLFKKG